jgi:tryptophan halogenase
MSTSFPRSILIVGGGVGGWMTAAAVVKALPDDVRIEVLRTATDAPRGALSTQPALRAFHARIGLDERDLLRAARGTFKLGSRFSGWTDGDHIEGFGDIGVDLDGAPFHQLWLRARALGETARLEDYSLAATAGRLGRFGFPGQDPRSILSTLSHGLHLDAAGYAAVLRTAAARARDRIGEIARIEVADGRIRSLVLAGGETLGADLFIDATDDGRLIDALGSPWTDWSSWLPCDRLASREVAPRANPPPLTEIEATEEGWLRRIPLRDADAVALAYRSDLTTNDDACEMLGGVATLTVLRNGRRERAWCGNCVAVGPAAGSLEPLNGADTQSIQNHVSKLIGLLPGSGSSDLLTAEYNRLVGEELDRARDLAVLRYAAATRSDPLWRAARGAPPPEPLAYKLAQFAGRGRVVLYDEEPCAEAGWIEALIGHRVLPSRHAPLADRAPVAQLRDHLARLRGLVRQTAQALPLHADALRDHA